jgi:acyl-CoA thioesterase-1
MTRRIVRNTLITLGSVIGATLAVFGIEVLMAIPGPDDHFHNPSRQAVHLGTDGPPLVYVVLGDSTAAGRGGDYAQGIAMQTAQHLAQSHRVTMVNLAISGAKIDDVVRDQLPKAESHKPNLVLLAVGANDATHFTPGSHIGRDLTRILKGLQTAQPRIGIVMTGCPAVGTVRRFAQPLRWLAGVQTNRVNAVMHPICRTFGAIWAPIARDTGTLFARDPTLLAPDRFHPNDRGYATWIPILNQALDKALLPKT